MENLAWYCVHAKPKCEHLAAVAIRSLPGVEVYCPRIRFQKSTTRGKVWFVEALFPGYLFAKFEIESSIRAVRHAQNVVRVLEFGGHPIPIRANAIDELRAEMDHDEVRLVHPTVKVGDAVQVTEGPMRGLTGIVERMLTGAERVRVLLDFLGRQSVVEVGVNKILHELPARLAISGVAD